jgi:hypothetical protein
MLMIGHVEPQERDGDDVDLERIETDVRRGRDPDEPTPHDVERVLRGEEEDAPSLRDSIASQARCARRDGDGEIEREETLAALGFAAHDPDGLVGPEPLDEPPSLGWELLELARAPDRETGHRRFAGAGVREPFSVLAGWKISKNSFSSSWLASRSAPAMRSSFACCMSVR